MSPHHADFACVMARTHRISEQGAWSLYMGPVYVYENDYTVHSGHAVDVDDVGVRVDSRAIHSSARR